MGRSAWSRTAPGPLEPYAVGFVQWLAEQGFSRSRIDRRLCQFGHLSHWLGMEGLAADELTVEHQQRFLDARQAAGYASWLSLQSLRVPLAYLREAGVAVSPASAVVAGPVERLLDDYRRIWRASVGWRRTRSITTSVSRGCSWQSTRSSTGWRLSASRRRM